MPSMQAWWQRLRHWLLCASTLAAASLLPAGSARADLVETVPRIKPSVVAIGSYLPTRAPQFLLVGTGFAVGDGRMIATNAHVVAPLLGAQEGEQLVVLKVEVTPQGPRQRVLKVARLASDPAHDIAVLKLIEGEALPALALGDPDNAREGQALAFTGFPIVGALGLNHATHRATLASITPTVIPQGKASELTPQAIQRLKSGAFNVFQLDATAYPGNSGSPVYDPDSGEVLAVVNMVWVKAGKESALTAPSGITYAVPVSYLKRLLSEPAK
ncbi:serine protease [Niveibacterium sp. SC-1]|uniref:S1 family peptidase n=1 Tax=Niveibacterium sp. SC-1 TaxID=3135646 RepID=UPI00311DBA18